MEFLVEVLIDLVIIAEELEAVHHLHLDQVEIVALVTLEVEVQDQVVELVQEELVLKVQQDQQVVQLLVQQQDQVLQDLDLLFLDLHHHQEAVVSQEEVVLQDHQVLEEVDLVEEEEEDNQNLTSI